jgi:predicted RNA-binding Zn-ribbon protein involved in translation (DUF1610 family)
VRCEECRKEADVEAHAVGWIAYLVDLADDPDPPEVIFYCPECANTSSTARTGREAATRGLM